MSWTRRLWNALTDSREPDQSTSGSNKGKANFFHST